jgi:hypothetical protein
MPVNNSMARRAVRDRLWLGVVAVGFAAFCGLLVIAGAQTSFGTAALSAFGFTSLSFAIASLLSARREESVHRLASELDQKPLLEDHSTDSGVDGTP